MIYMVLVAESLNQSYIRLTADKLSNHLVGFADSVLQPRALRDIYASVDYDMIQINGSQIVNKLSNALGKLAVSFRSIYESFISDSTVTKVRGIDGSLAYRSNNY